jgi:hypothetical protein
LRKSQLFILITISYTIKIYLADLKKKNSNFENVGWIPKKLDLFDDSDLLYKFLERILLVEIFLFWCCKFTLGGANSDFNLKYSINKDENTFWFFDKFNDIWYKKNESFLKKTILIFALIVFLWVEILDITFWRIFIWVYPITGLWEKTLKKPKILI